MRGLLRLVSVFLWLLPALAAAEPRIALVIGNGGYTNVAALRNPPADGALIANTLTDLEFEVTYLEDASLADMKRAIGAFGKRLREGGEDTVGLFYYAGHGVQSFGTNYLLPIDTALSNAADLDLVALEADSVLRQMRSARNRTNIFVLDACRNNPFEDQMEFGEDGLAEMKAPTGTYLAFATAPGGVAMDGHGQNSPFTEALAQQMKTPGLPIEAVFKSVRNTVLDISRGQQTPWDASSLTADFAFLEARQPSAEEVAELNLWRAVQSTRDPVQLMLFMKAYPNGQMQEQARALLSEVMEGEFGMPPGLATMPPGVAAAPPPPAAVAVPSLEEQDLIAQAQASGTETDYRAYLDAFPNGVFAELARSELVTIASKQAAAQTRVAALEAETTREPIYFDRALTSGGPAVEGRSLAELITGSPLYTPVEGMPDEFWKGKTCSNCHQWDQATLCEQGNRYLSESGARALGKFHPYGGGMKVTLQHWAESGCQ